MHEMTADEFFESLNGFDEIAISKHFGAKPIALSDTDPMAFARSLVFIAERRAGKVDADAKQAAMLATVEDVNGYFREDDETDENNPSTPAGKDDASPATSPTISPGSAS